MDPADDDERLFSTGHPSVSDFDIGKEAELSPETFGHQVNE